MKKISFRISDEFQNHAIILFIKNYLQSSQIDHQIFKMGEQIEFENFQAYVALTNSADTEILQTDILHFYSSSKPIAGFNESAKQIAMHLKKTNPVIAVTANDPEIPYLLKQGVETEICPPDDFITDRYTKILSSSIKLTDQNFNSAEQKGIANLCKELVEMC